jgi:hypothetical protein
MPRWLFLTSTSTSCRIFCLLGYSPERQEIRRAKLATVATATRDLDCPAGHCSPLIIGISPLTFERGSKNACRQLSLPLIASAKSGPAIFSAFPSTGQSTPQRTQDVHQDARAAAICSRSADYQPGVELFQQGMMAYQFAK